MPTATQARRSTAQKTQANQIPLAFVESTLSTAALSKGSKADRRRAQAKALKLVDSAAPRFRFVNGPTVVEGVVQGYGGPVTDLARLQQRQRLALRGGECRATVFPDYCAASNGEPVLVDLRTVTVEVSS